MSERGRLSRPLAVAVCLAAAVGVWLLFFPAILSADALDQYGQALRGEFNDWHPPVLALALAGVLRCGGDIWLLTLAQCVLGLLGVRALAVAVLGDLAGPRLSATGRAWAATGIALLLLIPLSPLAYYLATFWKDVWLAIVLVWIGALALARPTALRFAALMLLMTLALLLRHNALVMLPAFWLIGWLVLRRAGVRGGWLLAALPILLAPASDRLIHVAANVQRTQPVEHVMALELVGLCVLDPALRADLPYTDQSLVAPDWRQRYRFGDVRPLVWDPAPLVTPEYVAAADARPNAALRAEYWQAARQHPLALLRVKWRGFVPLLGLRETFYWVHSPHDGLDPNNHGLASPPVLRPARAAALHLADGVAGHRYWRWIAGVHAVWLGLATVACGTALFMTWRRQTGAALHAALLLVPLSYGLGHVLASVAHDFRYLYPATLFMQVYLAAALVAWDARRRAST